MCKRPICIKFRSRSACNEIKCLTEIEQCCEFFLRILPCPGFVFAALHSNPVLKALYSCLYVPISNMGLNSLFLLRKQFLKQGKKLLSKQDRHPCRAREPLTGWLLQGSPYPVAWTLSLSTLLGLHKIWNAIRSGPASHSPAAHCCSCHWNDWPLCQSWESNKLQAHYLIKECSRLIICVELDQTWINR